MGKRPLEETQTQTLLLKLKKAQKVEDIDRLMDGYQPLAFIKQLEALAYKKERRFASIFEDAQISRVYGYQILKGVRTPSRNIVLQLAFGLKLSLEETQSLLKIAGHQELYPKSKRDCYLIYSFNQRHSLMEANNLLYEKGFPLLSK